MLIKPAAASSRVVSLCIAVLTTVFIVMTFTYGFVSYTSRCCNTVTSSPHPSIFSLSSWFPTPSCSASEMLNCARLPPPQSSSSAEETSSSSSSTFKYGAYRHYDDRSDWNAVRMDFIFYPDGTYAGFIVEVEDKDTKRKTHEVGVYVVDGSGRYITVASVPGYNSPQFSNAEDFYANSVPPLLRRFYCDGDKGNKKLVVLDGPDYVNGTRKAKYAGACPTSSVRDNLPSL